MSASEGGRAGGGRESRPRPRGREAAARAAGAAPAACAPRPLLAAGPDGSRRVSSRPCLRERGALQRGQGPPHPQTPAEGQGNGGGEGAEARPLMRVGRAHYPVTQLPEPVGPLGGFSSLQWECCSRGWGGWAGGASSCSGHLRLRGNPSKPHNSSTPAGGTRAPRPREIALSPAASSSRPGAGRASPGIRSGGGGGLQPGNRPAARRPRRAGRGSRTCRRPLCCPPRPPGRTAASASARPERAAGRPPSCRCRCRCRAAVAPRPRPPQVRAPSPRPPRPGRRGRGRGGRGEGDGDRAPDTASAESRTPHLQHHPQPGRSGRPERGQPLPRSPPGASPLQGSPTVGLRISPEVQA